MFVDHLCDRIAQQYDILVKRFDLALQLDAVDQVNRHGHMLAAELVQERILQELAFVVAHDILRVPVIVGTLTITQSVVRTQKFNSNDA
jgi:4-aminobutyrate aminotransferase-like enzyme